jgi:hypothetical protein
MRQPILATRRPMGAEFVALWTSLVLPVATDSAGAMLLR